MSRVDWSRACETMDEYTVVLPRECRGLVDREYPQEEGGLGISKDRMHLIPNDFRV